MATYGVGAYSRRLDNNRFQGILQGSSCSRWRCCRSVVGVPTAIVFSGEWGERRGYGGVVLGNSSSFQGEWNRRGGYRGILAIWLVASSGNWVGGGGGVLTAIAFEDGSWGSSVGRIAEVLHGREALYVCVFFLGGGRRKQS